MGSAATPVEWGGYSVRGLETKDRTLAVALTRPASWNFNVDIDASDFVQRCVQAEQDNMRTARRHLQRCPRRKSRSQPAGAHPR